MGETWRKVEVSQHLRDLEKPFLTEVEELLQKWSGSDDETYWYLSRRLEPAAIGRNLVDQTKVKRQLFESQKGTCPECGQPLDSPNGHDVHKRQRTFARHQGCIPGNVVLPHRTCHDGGAQTAKRVIGQWKGDAHLSADVHSNGNVVARVLLGPRLNAYPYDRECHEKLGKAVSVVGRALERVPARS